MKIMIKTCICALILIFGLGLYGCSSSSSSGGTAGGAATEGLSYSGSTDPAEVDADNAQEIGEAAGEAVGQAASSSSLPLSIEVDQGTSLEDSLFDLVTEVADLALLPSGIDVSAQVCPGGGTADTSASGTGATSGSGPLVTTTTFNSCVTQAYTISGTVHIEFEDIGNQSSGFTVNYVNVTVSGLGLGTQTINYSFSCTNQSDFSTCTTSSVFTSSDGGNHRISEYSFSGNTSSGYNGMATFSHETYGSVSITVSNLTYGNCGASPDGGSISFSSSNGTSGQIDFGSDCSASGTWTSGTASGSF